ncbi:cupin domain-containing protein [Terrabacter sp. Root181]|uniref:cupin domain-containing protein n=1 Tax=Terrabacter sp. Root181 TaxID=1736484 RepID=UPI0009EA0A2B|nr:cupin domain-containing protein [Terrabacter sp. Root181]
MTSDPSALPEPELERDTEPHAVADTEPATERATVALLVGDVRTEPLDEQVPAGVEVLGGAPTAAVTTLAEVAGAEVGVWEMSPGTVTDVEADEVFVVLSGRAALAVEGGATLELGPGSVVRLPEGARTVWTVTETLRKIYVTPRA